jgi:biopolymer transport protein ExbB/TolQ
MSFRTLSMALWSFSAFFVLMLAAGYLMHLQTPIGLEEIVHRPSIGSGLPVLLILLLFVWVLFEIAMRQRAVRREHQAVDEFQSVLAKADLGEYQPKTYNLSAPRAIRRADMIIECSRRDPSSLHEAIPAAAALDASTLNAAYTPLNVYAWILPVLGFIGTASGMAASIGGFKDALHTGEGQVEALSTELGQSVIPGLAGAFETTILALGAALVAYLCTSALRSWDQQALDQLDRLCIVLLSRIPHPPSPDGEKILVTLQKIYEQIAHVLQVPINIESAAKAISDTAQALGSSSNQFGSAVSAIGLATEALAGASKHSESAATALQSAAESLKQGDGKAAWDDAGKGNTGDALAAVLKDIQKTLQTPMTVEIKRG